MSDFWDKVVSSIPIVGPVVGALASSNATSAAKDAASRSDAMEQQRFEEAKRQADILRQRGDEAAAVAMEEAARAEMGAAKYEALSRQYAIAAEQGAARREDIAVNLYNKIGAAADARQTAGQDAKTALLSAGANVQDAARRNESLQKQGLSDATGYMTTGRDQAIQGIDKAFGGVEARWDPYLQSERGALGQLNAEMGLGPGEQNKTYRDSPAYAASMEAARVAEEDARAVIDQAAGNSGTLYSGTRGAALVDRANRGSYERAGIEQNYYNNYMTLLRDMANPTATTALSNYETQAGRDKAQIGMDTSRYLSDATLGTNARIGDMNFNAAGANLNAVQSAEQVGLNTMRSGSEGVELMAYLDPGTAGAPYALNGIDYGTSGTPYRLGAQDYRTNATTNAAGMITGNMPTGTAGNNYRLQGVEASNMALSDFASGAGNIYSSYLQHQQPQPINMQNAFQTPYPYMTSQTRVA